MKPKPKKKVDLHVGTWGGVDEFQTNLEYTVRKTRSGYKIKVVDTYDGEKPDVFEEAGDEAKGIFSFAAYWNSTGTSEVGRLSRCLLRRHRAKHPFC